MDTTNLNLNAADCIKSASNIGSTVYVNICNGTIQNVPWGGADWLGAVAVGFMAVFFCAVFAFLGVSLFRMATDNF